MGKEWQRMDNNGNEWNNNGEEWQRMAESGKYWVIMNMTATTR